MINNMSIECISRPYRSIKALLLASTLIASVSFAGCSNSSTQSSNSRATSSSPTTAPAPAPAGGPQPQMMEVAKAVMVTVELDFGGKPPTIAQAIQEIERRHQPDDGQGRTFAILDAYGEPTPDGKLHMSMHVSSEKPGTGSLVFRRTGEVLWTSRITGSPVSSQKNLGIIISNGQGSEFNVDGSNQPSSVLEAKVRGSDKLVKDMWPDGAEREVTFIYSACGCPVKTLVKRIGNKTVRTKDTPVIFPDDPAAVLTISRLMGWQ